MASTQPCAPTDIAGLLARRRGVRIAFNPCLLRVDAVEKSLRSSPNSDSADRIDVAPSNADRIPNGLGLGRCWEAIKAEDALQPRMPSVPTGVLI